MTVVYDAGMLIALERSDRRLWARHRARFELRNLPVTTAPVVAQVSRSDQQAQLRRVLSSCTIVDFAAADAHAVGALLKAARTSDVVDAHLVHVASALNATVLTSDERDIARLASHVSGDVDVQPL